MCEAGFAEWCMDIKLRRASDDAERWFRKDEVDAIREWAAGSNLHIVSLPDQLHQSTAHKQPQWVLAGSGGEE